jgi:hypothetical protein
VRVALPERQHRDGENQRQADLNMRLLYWAPRVLAILFAVFISLFALDVFSEGRGFLETALALLIHLVPTVLVLGVLVFSWKREWIGALFFPALGILYVILAWGKFPVGTNFIIAGPPVIVGALFLVNWRLKVKKGTR